MCVLFADILFKNRNEILKNVQEKSWTYIPR